MGELLPPGRRHGQVAGAGKCRACRRDRARCVGARAVHHRRAARHVGDEPVGQDEQRGPRRWRRTTRAGSRPREAAMLPGPVGAMMALSYGPSARTWKMVGTTRMAARQPGRRPGQRAPAGWAARPVPPSSPLPQPGVQQAGGGQGRWPDRGTAPGTPRSDEWNWVGSMNSTTVISAESHQARTHPARGRRPPGDHDLRGQPATVSSTFRTTTVKTIVECIRRCGCVQPA